MKTKIMLGTVGTLLVAGLVFGGSNAFAKTNSGEFSNIVDKLVQKFGLEKTEVQQVFEEMRTERQAKNENRYKNMLEKAVENGKLTEAQKSLLIAKHQELQKSRAEKPENWQDLSQTEKKAFMDKNRTELEAWAKENNIDVKYLVWGFGREWKKGIEK